MINNNEKEKNIFIEDEIQSSYLDYSMSVIVGRALPDVRDGLKPVHRRILYAMHETGMNYNKPFKKSARIVGEVLGKYHPHGDASVYFAMVRMGQDFNMRYNLVLGQGNYGSIDGDAPASMRYTEAKLTKLASEMLTDIDKNTVKFKKNFDETLEEPVVLPSKVPNLLINGSSGIAVGMATNIPPHNLIEVCDAILALIENKDINLEELLKFVKGPDFPTGGVIVGKKELVKAYTTGRGIVRLRGKARIEADDKREAIIIYELPYQVNKAVLVQTIAELVKEKKIEGISDLRDESDREGIRIYIQVKRGEDAELILNKIYKYTNLQVSFGIIMLALVNNIPKVLNLKEILECYLAHRFEVTVKRITFELGKAEDRLHVLEGFKLAISSIDETIRIIKSSKDSKEAKEKLIKSFTLSETQAQAILDMRLSKLTGLEVEKLNEEIGFLTNQIAEFKKVLANDSEVYRIIKEEVKELKTNYKDKRKTEITDEIKEINEEDLIKDEQVLVTLTGKGYIKRQVLEGYKSQKLGGKGYTGQGLADDDFIKNIYMANNLDTLLIFTDKGKVHRLKVYELPESSRIAKGKLLSNLINIAPSDRVKSIIKTRDFNESKAIFFVTKEGIVKKTTLSLFKNISKAGIIAIKLRKEDDLLSVFLVEKGNEIFLATRKGYAIKFKESSVRPSGRSSSGVRGIKFRDGDILVGGEVISSKDSTILTIAEKGYGKRTPSEEYKITNRGGKGIINMKVTSKTGNVVLADEILDNEGLLLITSKGSIIRTEANTISTIGRSTQGIRIIRLRENEVVVDAIKIPKDYVENEE